MDRCRTNNRKPSYFFQGGQSGYLNLACTLLLLAAIALLSSLAQAAKPGGVPVLLPPFIPTPAPFPFIQASSPFAIIGFIQSAAVTTPNDVFSGGTVTVNGITIVVPRNTILQMPASTMTWQEVFSNAPAAYKALNQTGLALSDVPKPLTTYEINVQGNRVNYNGTDQYVAGLIFVSNQAANISQGFINFIDYSKGEMWVSQSLTAGPAGARVRLNTAKGRYGPIDANADVRFTSDEDNPTISARTGYPMCLPRVDPKSGNDSLCPQWNRPVDPYTGAFATNFTMQPTTAGAADANGITHQVGYPTPAVQPDPFEQAPFEVGDYVTFNGTLTADSVGQYISAHTVSADVGIFTAPGTWPVYVALGEFRIGVGGTPNPFFPQEALEKIFGDVFTTDSTALVDVYAVDVDPCTGARTHRFYYTSNPFGPPLGGLKGRARFRTTIGNFLPATREMAVSSRSLTGNGSLDQLGTLKLVANGLAAGTFQAPQFEFIFPENLIIGSPPIPLTFQEFPFLVNGFGPYVPFNSASGAPVGTVGQLNPWPAPNAPAPSCTIGLTLLQPPVPNAGAPLTVTSGANVGLDGGFSVDPNTPALPIIYTWQQSAGPAVALTDSYKQKPHFQAPIVPAGGVPVALTFQLAACNGFTCGGVSSTTVTVNPALPLAVTLNATPSAGVSPGTTVTLDAAATGGTGTLKYSFTQSSGTPQTLKVNGSTATFPLIASATNLAFTVTVTDSASPAATVISAPVNVTVAVPLSAVTLSASPANVHNGSPVTLNAIATGGVGALKYMFSQVSTGAPAQALVQSPTSPSASLTVNAPGTATLTFQVSVSDQAATTLTTTVNVTVSPGLAVTLSALPKTIQQNAPVTLTASAQGGTAPLTYAWSQTAGQVQALKTSPASGSASFTPNANTVMSFTVTVTDNATSANTATASITLAPALAVTLSAAPTSHVHQGSAVALTATATGGSSPYKYAFTQSAGPVQILMNPTSTSPTFVVNLGPIVPATPTTLTFNVVVTDASNQSQTVPVNIVVDPADHITVTNVVYTISKSKLQVAASTDALPKGGAVLTVTPQGPVSAIVGVTKGTTTVLTAVSNGFVTGTTPTLTISGATGAWSVLNGTFVVRVISSTQFSIPVDSSAIALAAPAAGSLSFEQSFGADVVCIYNPTLDTYNVLADIVQPGPDHITIRSSYGGITTSPITRTR